MAFAFPFSFFGFSISWPYMIHRDEDVEQLSSFPQGVIVYSIKHMAQEQLFVSTLSFLLIYVIDYAIREMIREVYQVSSSLYHS